MEFKDYITNTVRKNCSTKFYNDLDKDLVHAIVGLSTESAELLDKVKKYTFFGKGFNDQDIIDEAGDVCWYLALLCDHYGIDFSKLMEYNAKKIAKRFEKKAGGYPEVNREAERKAQFGENQYRFWGL